MQGTGTHPIEKVEDCTYNNPKQSQLRVMKEGKASSYAARDEITASNTIGDMLLDTHNQWLFIPT